MSLKRTIWLAFIFIGLGFFLFYVYIPWEVRIEDERKQQRELFSFTGDDVTRIAVQYPDWKINIQKVNDKEWEITEPVSSLANNIVVENIVMFLPTMNVLHVVDENPSDISIYGLASPAMKMFVTLKNGKEAISLGDDSAKMGSNYAILNDDKRVVLVPSELKKALMRSIEGWKKKQDSG